MNNSQSSTTTDFFYKLPKSRQHLISLAILFVIPLILFFDTTLGGKELQRHDITEWRSSSQSIIEYREKFNNEPLWATNVFGGMPSFVISVDNKSVPNFDIIAPFFQGIYPAFQFWVMLSGMYLLLIIMGFRPLSAVIGSIMFGLTTYFPVIIMAGHTSKFFTLAFSPWVIAGYWLLSRSNKKILGLLIFSVSLALNIRAGHPQITYYFFYLIGIFYLFDTWIAIKSRDFKNWAFVTSLLLIGGIIGILGNAERILTLQEYAKHSMRGGSAIKGTSGLDTGYAFAWSQGISETLTLFIPDIFGGSSPNYWGPKSSTSGPHYLSALSLPFIIISLFKVRKKEMFVFLAVGTLAIFFAWGENFLLLNKLAFDFIPFFDKFRAPETWLVLTVFCYSIVAIYGLEWFFDFVKNKSVSIKPLYRSLGSIIGVFILLLLFINSLSFINPSEVDRIAYQIAQQNQVSPENAQVQQQATNYVTTRLVPERDEKAKGDLLRLAILLIVVFGILYLVTTSKMSISLGSLAFILLIGIDLTTVAKRYMPEKSFVASNFNAEKYLASQERDIDRYIREHISENSAYPYRVFPLIDNPFSSSTQAFFYPVLGGYTAAKLSIVQDTFMANGNPLYSGAFGINLELLGLLNTKYITYNPGLQIPGLTPVFNGQSGVVYEVENVLPKAFFVDSTITVEEPSEAYAMIFPEKVNFSTTAVVEDFSASTSFDSTSSVKITNYTGAEISMNISRSKPGFLVLSEIYYPDGWEALLDGKKIDIHKTNYLVRGFQIPAGEHVLELDFKPSSYSTGIMLSWFSFFGQVSIAILFCVSHFRSRKNDQQ